MYNGQTLPIGRNELFKEGKLCKNASYWLQRLGGIGGCKFYHFSTGYIDENVCTVTVSVYYFVYVPVEQPATELHLPPLPVEHGHITEGRRQLNKYFFGGEGFCEQ